MAYVDFKAIKQAIPIEQAAKLLNIMLKPSGGTLRAQCPCGTSDDERSLAVTPAKQAYFCHAAEVGGDCISLVAHVLAIGMRDAAEWLQDTLPSREVTAPQKPAGRNQPAASQSTREPIAPASVQKSAKVDRPFDPSTFAAKLLFTEEVEALGFTPELAERFEIGMTRGKVFLPIRDTDGSIAGFVSFANGELKLPPRWLPQQTNVVKLPKRA